MSRFIWRTLLINPAKHTVSPRPQTKNSENGLLYILNSSPKIIYTALIRRKKNNLYRLNKHGAKPFPQEKWNIQIGGIPSPDLLTDMPGRPSSNHSNTVLYIELYNAIGISKVLGLDRVINAIFLTRVIPCSFLLSVTIC